MVKEKQIVMLGTRSDAFGGIASVVALYEKQDLFVRQHVVYLPTHSTGSSLTKCILFISSVARFYHLLLQGAISIVHTHVACDMSFWRKAVFLLLARASGIPTILHIHAGHFPEFYEKRCNRAERAIVRYLLDKVQHVVVVSNTLNAWVRSISTQRSVLTIFNPAVIEEKENSPLRDQATLLFLGHLGKAKGTYDLLHAMPKVISAFPDVRLVLCGDGDTAGAQKSIELLGLAEHVQVAGWIDTQSRARWLSKATVLVLPSYAEGLPMSVLEAMAARLPVIATRVGGIPEAINSGSEGLLVEPGDVRALANGIVHLLGNPDQRRMFADSARSKVEHEFSVDKTISSLERLYDQIRRSQARAQARPALGRAPGHRQPDTDRQF
ncbi:glycosyltransferase family 4 protein [Massilia terrae]|uniref:Glycosyltransferase family 4 protein n=1 Tax=Massilia terrae TaxID=1811224 RepID=A0ABT2CYX5_9BURK|nr:glycosyltransferase family 4 protein [Massilia terrae]MCS0659005.1 glycosyltransferase family 4 protein [Massilia terrae]